MSKGFRERYFTSGDGLRLYFRDYGDPLAPATPLLCLPGLTRNSKDFHFLALTLCPNRRVLCPDLRGRGLSQYDPNWRRYVPPTYVEDMRHLLASLNLHKVVAIGTSLGGILAAAMAVAAPNVLVAAVLNDVGPEIDLHGLGRIIAYMSDNRPQADWRHATAHLRKMFPDLTVEDDEGWRRLARNTYRTCEDGLLRFDYDPNVIKPLLGMGQGTGRGTDQEAGNDLWPLFRALGRVPILALRGGKSDILSEATFERMKTRLPGLRQVTIKDTGHAPILTESVALKAIEAFLESLY